MASWVGLSNQPSFNADTMLLLTDGTVMVHEYESANWHRLTPDAKGSYIKGTWSSLASLPTNSVIPTSVGGPTDAPLYFASAILRDGRVFMAGGEYNTGIANSDIASTQIYDPLADAWTTITPPPALPQVGDAISCVLADGRVMIGTSAAGSSAVDILDPETLTWEPSGPKGDSPSEESWTLMPNGAVLAVQCSNSPNAEQYDPASDTWVAAGATPSALPQACPGNVAEIGPALLLPDGRVFAIGATGATALYTPNADPTVAGTWTAGPNLNDGKGNTLYPMDAPAVLLPSGKVLLTASPGPPCGYPGPLYFLLYDPTGNTASVVTGPSNNSEACYQSRLLLLPNGQVLHSNNTSDIEVYEPDGAPQSSWAPVITDFPSVLVLGHTYTLSGIQFNGLSQACAYGDDAQMATNYPIARLSNAAGEQRYLRTASFSTMGVATGSALVSADVTVVSRQGPIPPGPWQLSVIANGIASNPVNVTVAVQDCLLEIERNDYGAGEIQALIETGGKPAVIDPALYVLIEGFSQDAIGSNLPTIPDPLPGVSFHSSGPAVPSDPTLPSSAIQSFTFQFAVHFADDSMFGSADQTLTVSASFSDTQGNSVQTTGEIYLLATPNPYILHGGAGGGQQWYLSLDLGVFQVNGGQGAFDASMPATGDAPTNAETFIKQVIKNLNAPGSNLAGQFEATVAPTADSNVNLAITDGSGNPIYNFALARVRYQDVGPADNVRVFFRLWQAQQTNATYDTATYYRSAASGTSKIPLLGLEGDEIITIPFFAEKRIVTTAASMTTQADPANVQTLQPGAGGALTEAYFGCWLDVNQNTAIFPPWMANVTHVDGPYPASGNLVSIQQLVRATHQCLIAEIAFDPDPIPANADPSTSDKLAQRNLAFVDIPNPGVEASRVAPQPLEIRPSRKTLLPDGRPDELMITWDHIPKGGTAQVYLPRTTSTAILDWAGRLYANHALTAADAHTITVPTGGVTYIPIPQSADGLNLMGLLSVSLPAHVHKGDQYEITVRQLTSQTYQPRIIDVRDVAPREDRPRIWRRVSGIFHLTIPVSTKAALLGPETRTYSILRWIGESIPSQSRWRPVFDRYLLQWGGRIAGLGGDPTKVEPSPNGGVVIHHPHPGPGHGEGREEWTGKVRNLIYNHFGDFEGFTLTFEHGEPRRFHSRETKVEEIARDALAERWTLTVVTDHHDPHRLLWLILGGAPV